jgi:hypothetical protein
VNRGLTRRVRAPLAVSAALAIPALTGWASPALARAAQAPGRPPAQAHGTRQSPALVIDAIGPSRFARPGATVTVSGHFTAGAGTPQQGLNVRVWSSASPLTVRSQLGAFAKGSYQAAGYSPVATSALPTRVDPGQTVSWQVSFKVDQVGMRPAGVSVYPLAADVADPAGTQIAVERTFLPFWPGTKAAGQPVRVAWVWPLIDQPQRGVCSAVLDNSLAASLASGRLAGLLDVGRDYASSAKLTWAVDPALLDDTHAMTTSYQVLDGPNCWQVKREPASAAARRWLATLGGVTADQPVFATPYADPDVAGLTHLGLDSDLAAALSDGSAVASKYLEHPDPTIAWPPDGLADAGVVDNLLAQGGSVQGGSLQGGIQTFVLDSDMMPPTNPSLYYTPDAVASVPTGVGATVRVLLADHDLTTVLGASSAAGAGSAGSSAGGAIETSQRFLAETAMIAAQAPNLSRSVVVAPPGRWDPGAALASQLLSDTVSAPWLRPAYLNSLREVTTPPGVPAPKRAVLPSKLTSLQLTPQYLARVRVLGNDMRLFESILVDPESSYRLVIARLESSAWRGGGKARGADLLHQAGLYVAEQERMVAIIRSSEVTLGGSRGTIPVTIDNKLPTAVRVRLTAIVPATRAVPASARLSVGSVMQRPITIGAGLKQTVRLQVHAHSGGVTQIQLRLLTPRGTPIPGSDRTLKIRTTAFGSFGLGIIAVALGVLVITFVARVLRSGLREGRPGSVVAEDMGTDDNGSAEAPDELADARRRTQPDARQ